MSVAVLAFTAIVVGQTPGLEAALAKEARALEAEAKALRVADAQREAEHERARSDHQARAARLARELERLRIEVSRLDAERRQRDQAPPAARTGDPVSALANGLAESHGTRADDDPDALVRRILSLDAGDRSVRTSTGSVFDPAGRPRRADVLYLGALAAYARTEGMQGALQKEGGAWVLEAPADVSRLFGASGPALVPLVWGKPHEGASDERPPFFRSRIEAGGGVAWVILVLAGLAGLVFLGRLVELATRTRGDEAFTEGFVRKMVERRVAEATTMAADRPGFVGALARARLEAENHAPGARGALVQAALVQQVGAVERGADFIKLVAAVAPLLGLLGTVMGMIETFEVLGTHGAGDARLLSGGISKALVTTELGLVVAIPTLFAHSLLSSWVDRVVDRLERIGGHAGAESTVEPSAVSGEGVDG